MKSYGDGVRGFLRWCHTGEMEPELTRRLGASLLEEARPQRRVHVGTLCGSGPGGLGGEPENDELVGLRLPLLNGVWIVPPGRPGVDRFNSRSSLRPSWGWC